MTLVEIPSADEFADNIVAFWRPEAPLAEGKEYQYTYRLTWAPTQPEDLPLAPIVATRSGLSILDARERLFVVDFDLGMIEFEGVTPRIEANAATMKGVSSTGCRRQHRPRRVPLPAGEAERRVPAVAGERGREGVRNLALPLECLTRTPAGRRRRRRQRPASKAGRSAAVTSRKGT